MTTQLSLHIGPTLSTGEVAEQHGQGSSFRPSMTISHALTVRGATQYKRSEFALSLGGGIDDVYTQKAVGDSMPTEHATGSVRLEYLQAFSGTGVVLLSDLGAGYRDLSARSHQGTPATKLRSLIETVGTRNIGASVGIGYRLSDSIMFSASAETTYDTEVPEAPLVGAQIALLAETMQRRFHAGASIQRSVGDDNAKKLYASRAALFVSFTEYFNNKRSGMTLDFSFTNKALSLGDSSVEGYRFAFGAGYTFRSSP